MREFGRAARMWVARTYLGYDPKQMALALNVRAGTYQRWESNKDPIPTGIWDELNTLYAEFDQQVAGIVARALEDPDADVVPIPVARHETRDHPVPKHHHRVVGEAARRDPRIEPVMTLGRSARLLVSRVYLGLSNEELLSILDITDDEQKRWEAGEPIPADVLDELDNLYSEFDKDTAAILAQAEAQPDAEHVEVRVTRGRTDDNPHPGWRLRTVSEAVRREPRIMPVFPESADYRVPHAVVERGERRR
ncbi:hypothetical protein [Nocardia carnea]|uniref:hypothetical protein n=1 Tax=Nocardia carnea TaxID=37328 RepID=UPI002453B39D|nr:hypothetical protein [Nocardia carnea]